MFKQLYSLLLPAKIGSALYIFFIYVHCRGMGNIFFLKSRYAAVQFQSSVPKKKVV